MEESKVRIVTHFDLDAFYCACEREINPLIRNVPLGVSQYNPHGDTSGVTKEEIDKRLVVAPNNKTKQPWNGSLIAVSYEARAEGVRRGDRGSDAVKKCSELYVMQVPVKRGKADIAMYRDAGLRVLKVLADGAKESVLNLARILGLTEKEVKITVEKASIDEIYIDLTEAVSYIESNCDKNISAYYDEVFNQAALETTIGGMESSNSGIATNKLSKDDIRKGSSLQVIDSAQHNSDPASMSWWEKGKFDKWSKVEQSLALGTVIASRARSHVLRHFDSVFTLSGGISINKTMAKLASGLKKPNRQTLINPRDFLTLQQLFHPLPVGRIKGLGGKFGEEVSKVLGVTTVGELAMIPLPTIASHFPDQAQFLYDIAQGKCTEEVKERIEPKSIGSGKNFRHLLSFLSSDKDTLTKWLEELSLDLIERLELDHQDYNRCPQKINLSLRFSNTTRFAGSAGAVSRTANIPSSNEQYVPLLLKLANDMIQTSVGSANDINIVNVSMNANTFVSIGSNSIRDAFQKAKVAIAKDDIQRQKMNKHDSNNDATSPVTIHQSTKNSNSMSSLVLKKLASPTKKSRTATMDIRNAFQNSSRMKNRPKSTFQEQIDSNVLAELPVDIQNEILGNRSLKSITTKRKGIESFFIRKG